MADVMIGTPKRAMRAARLSAMDTHVGARVRAGRMHRGFTMTMLGDAIGVTDGQIEKYERGDNGIIAGRLHAISRALNIAPGWFFDAFAADESLAWDKPDLVDPERAAAITLAEEILAMEAPQRRAVRDMVRKLKEAAAASGDAAVA
jgi:transcriptional regulator with XRE-family HTH domain